VDETDSIGMTALHRAIQGSAEAVVELLLQRGADVERSADTYTFGTRATSGRRKRGLPPGD